MSSNPADRSWGSSRDPNRDISNLGFASNSAIAPFLTNVESHLGRVTLTAPDNIRRTNNDSRARSQRNMSAATLRARASVQRLRATVQPTPTVTRTVRPARSVATMPTAPPPGLVPTVAVRTEVRPSAPMDREHSPAPTTESSAATNDWSRRVNVWDDIERLQNLDRTDPPPPFSVTVHNQSSDQVTPTPVRRVPNSPPPAFESDGERELEPAGNGQEDSHPSEDEADESLDPAVLRERDAWERDRLLGYSLEERVQRMERRKLASEASGADYLRRRWQNPPRDPSSTLQVVRAPAPQFVDVQGPQSAPVDDSSSEDERPRPVEEDSDHEWESEHNALDALYQYEADMRRTLSHDRVIAHRTSRHIPLSLQPGTLVRESRQDSRESVSGSFSHEELADAVSPVSLASPVSSSSERPPPVLQEAAAPQLDTAARGSSTPTATMPDSALDSPLPPPPPSRVSLIRAAYDQLYELRRDQRVFRQFDSDIAGLEDYLSRYEPLHDGSGPSNPMLTHFGGAFTNPRSSGAPRPTQAHLPVITDATRHFPPTEPGPPAPKPPLPPRREPPGIQASGSTLPSHEDMPSHDVLDQERPQDEALPSLQSTTDSLITEQGPSQLIPAPALQNPFLQEPLDTVPLAPEAPTEPVGDALEAPAEQAPVILPPDEEITDLDFAVAHLDDPEMRYEWASLISDYLGPAREQTHLSLQELQHISVGRVELESRRVTSAGRVRVRLSVAGIRVERCSVCLEQFKGGQKACILPCLHMYVCNC